ncbi:MAG TPA: RIP metalloprotease RseP [Xanthobacteraceae bacterium]|nr:RIP metalloprotease RseP [Xanthobacteraceae bacterium]
MGSYLLSHLHALGGGVVAYLIPWLLVLSVVVFFHELGHFLVARWCSVKVLVFSIGFGPEIAGFYDRYGTRWKIAAIPLGGYVKFFGDENAGSAPDAARLESMNDAERRQSFFFQPVLKRAAIVVAGPMANFVLAVVIFAALFAVYGKQTMSPRVDAVQSGSPAAAAGFQPGDLVVSIDGKRIDDFEDMQRIVSESAGDPLKIRVDRKGLEIALTATPALKEEKDLFGNVHRIGLLGIQHSPTPAEMTYRPVSPPRAFWMALQETWMIVDRTLAYLGGVVTGHKSADQISGPIGIAHVVGQAATVSFAFVIRITAVISVSIGLLNLFPIPLLDGGHLLFYAIEALRGRPLSERAQEVGFRIGLAIVVMLMIFATFNDIVHLRTS